MSRYTRYIAIWNADGLRVLTASGVPVGTVQHERDVDGLITRHKRLTAAEAAEDDEGDDLDEALDAWLRPMHLAPEDLEVRP